MTQGLKITIKKNSPPPPPPPPPKNNFRKLQIIANLIKMQTKFTFGIKSIWKLYSATWVYNKYKLKSNLCY